MIARFTPTRAFTTAGSEDHYRNSGFGSSPAGNHGAGCIDVKQTEPPVSTSALVSLVQHDLRRTANQYTMPLLITDFPAKVPSQSYDEHEAAASALAPLLSHEIYSQRPTEAQDEQDIELKYSYNCDEDKDVHDDDISPLLRHESLVQDSVEQTQTTFLGEEAIAIGEDSNKHHKSLRCVALPSLDQTREAAVASEADPNDPSLERFPTDPIGITEHIRRLSTKIACIDEDNAKDDSRVKTASGAIALSSFASLPNVREDDEELGGLRDDEHERYFYSQASTYNAPNQQPEKAPSVSRLPSLCGSSPSICEDNVCQETSLQHKSASKEVILDASHRSCDRGKSCDQVQALGPSVPPPTASCTPPEYVYEDAVNPDFSREFEIAYSASIARDEDRCHRYGADVSTLWKRGSTPVRQLANDGEMSQPNHP